jgi:hypothetical protein
MWSIYLFPCFTFFLLLLTSFWIAFCFVALLWNILPNGLVSFIKETIARRMIPEDS